MGLECLTSYGPTENRTPDFAVTGRHYKPFNYRTRKPFTVRWMGFEPISPEPQSSTLNHLSYSPKKLGHKDSNLDTLSNSQICCRLTLYPKKITSIIDNDFLLALISELATMIRCLVFWFHSVVINHRYTEKIIQVFCR